MNEKYNSKYVLCMVFVTKYEGEFEIGIVLLLCSDKSDEINM